MGVYGDFVGRIGDGEGEWGFFAGGGDVAEEYGAAYANAGVQGDRRDEGARDAGLEEFAADLKAFFGFVRGVFGFVAGDAGAANVFGEEPFHGAAAFQVHFGGHDRFDFLLQLLRG